MRKTSWIYLCVVLLLTCCGKKEERVNPEPPKDYYSLLRSVNKLSLAEMAVSKMGSVDDLTQEEADGAGQKLQAFLNSFKIGSRKGAYSYNTYLRAYLDLNKLGREDVNVDTVAKIMHIVLPEIETEFIGRDVEMREEHYRVTGLRSSITAGERARVKEAMNESLKKEVEERSGFRERLKTTGREKAVAYFSTLASEAGYTADIKFKE